MQAEIIIKSEEIDVCGTYDPCDEAVMQLDIGELVRGELVLEPQHSEYKLNLRCAFCDRVEFMWTGPLNRVLDSDSTRNNNTTLEADDTLTFETRIHDFIAFHGPDCDNPAKFEQFKLLIDMGVVVDVLQLRFPGIDSDLILGGLVSHHGNETKY